ncbi:MAG: DUF885 domain-containing protein [Lachnospiraceae bacterium]|mgnify:FL=1|jgi:uncharacterized protein (DUF885 family)|nr:hypothetical protein C819_00656 [Lachnospiraceae bacterium 10-1]MCX4352114.1 DUF885 domain-containing protein [Lachnospiraceae bacterium]
MENETKKSNVKVIALIAGLVCIMILCAVGAILLIGNKASDSERFEAYIDNLFMEDVVGNTINLHYTLARPEDYGITDYEVTLGDYSTDDEDESYKELEAMRKELLKFDREKLTDEQRLTYDILLDSIELSLSVTDLTYYDEWLGVISGYQAQLPVILAEYTFRTEKDIQDYLELISQIDEMYEEVIVFEEKKSEAGLFMADYVADEVIAQCEEFIADPEENYMLEIFEDKIEEFEGLTKEKKEEYIQENYEIITTQVVEGYQTLIDGLTSLKGTGTNELGLCYYEDGREYYEYLVRVKTGSDESVKRLQRKVDSFMNDRMRLIQDVIMKDPMIYYDFVDYEYEMRDPKEIVEDLKDKIEEDFPKPPAVDYTIKYVHPSMEEHMSPAFYLTTPIDDLQNNLIYINAQKNTEDTNLYSTLAHEGYPGHLYQNAYTNSGDMPLIRSLMSYNGYSEGWATYVEFEYSYDYMGMSEGLADVASTNTALSLGLYAYADMGVHYDGWDRDDLADYLAEFGIEGEDVVDDVFNALVEEPANYLSYFVGYLQFVELRDMARKELGRHFDTKEFHKFLLETGPAPFYIIENYMEEWMKEQ